MTALLVRRRSRPSCVKREKMSRASSEQQFSQPLASILCGCPPSESAIQTLTSRKNKVIGILVDRIPGTSLASRWDHRSGYPLALLRLGIGVLDGMHNERTDG